MLVQLLFPCDEEELVIDVETLLLHFIIWEEVATSEKSMVVSAIFHVTLGQSRMGVADDNHRQYEARLSYVFQIITT